MDDSNNSSNSSNSISPFSGARETKQNEIEVCRCEHSAVEISLDIINACLKHCRNFSSSFIFIQGSTYIQRTLLLVFTGVIKFFKS